MDENVQEVPISVLNQMIHNVENFHMALTHQGWYLPPYNRGWITFEYLWKVFNEDCFRVKRDQVKRGVAFKKVTKIGLYQELAKKIQNIGFTSEKLPDMQWMIDVLNTIDPKNKLLSKEKTIVEEPKILVSMAKLKELELDFVRGNKAALFKMNSVQKDQKIEAAKNRDIERAIHRNEYYEKQLIKAQLNLKTKQIKKNKKNNVNDQEYFSEEEQLAENAFLEGNQNFEERIEEGKSMLDIQ